MTLADDIEALLSDGRAMHTDEMMDATGEDSPTHLSRTLMHMRAAKRITAHVDPDNKRRLKYAIR